MTDTGDVMSMQIRPLNYLCLDSIGATMCSKGQWHSDVPTVKRIVEQAIEIRREQVDSLIPDQQTDWNDQLTVDFKAGLGTRIRELNNLGR